MTAVAAPSSRPVVDRILLTVNEPSNDRAASATAPARIVLFMNEADGFVREAGALKDRAARLDAFRELARKAGADDLVLTPNAVSVLNAFGRGLGAKERVKANESVAAAPAVKVTKEQAKTLAKALGDELRKADVRKGFPQFWNEALGTVKAKAGRVEIVYDYEFFAGGRGEEVHVKEMERFVQKLIASTPALSQFQHVPVTFFGPDAT